MTIEKAIWCDCNGIDDACPHCHGTGEIFVAKDDPRLGPRDDGIYNEDGLRVGIEKPRTSSPEGEIESAWREIAEARKRLPE